MPTATKIGLNQRAKEIDLEPVAVAGTGTDRSIATVCVATRVKYVSSSLRTRRS